MCNEGGSLPAHYELLSILSTLAFLLLRCKCVLVSGLFRRERVRERLHCMLFIKLLCVAPPLTHSLTLLVIVLSAWVRGKNSLLAEQNAFIDIISMGRRCIYLYLSLLLWIIRSVLMIRC